MLWHVRFSIPRLWSARRALRWIGDARQLFGLQPRFQEWHYSPRSTKFLFHPLSITTNTVLHSMSREVVMRVLARLNPIPRSSTLLLWTTLRRYYLFSADSLAVLIMSLDQEWWSKRGYQSDIAQNEPVHCQQLQVCQPGRTSCLGLELRYVRDSFRNKSQC